jgi:hypothetical protein
LLQTKSVPCLKVKRTGLKAFDLGTNSTGIGPGIEADHVMPSRVDQKDALSHSVQSFCNFGEQGRTVVVPVDAMHDEPNPSMALRAPALSSCQESMELDAIRRINTHQVSKHRQG